jgi:hypothetical protein
MRSYRWEPTPAFNNLPSTGVRRCRCQMCSLNSITCWSGAEDICSCLAFPVQKWGHPGERSHESLTRSVCTICYLRTAEIFIGPHENQPTERIPLQYLLLRAYSEVISLVEERFCTPAPDRNETHKSLMFTRSQGLANARSLCVLFIGSGFRIPTRRITGGTLELVCTWQPPAPRHMHTNNLPDYCSPSWY